LSDGWFHGFRDRKLIAYRVPTSQAQEMPEQYRDIALCFLRFLRRNSMPRPGEMWKPDGIGRFHRRLVFNVDQMALPFSFTTGRTYAPRGAHSVKSKTDGAKTWIRRMATLMIMVTADGELRCKPLLIFRGKGTTKALRNEHKFYDKRVVVAWQKKAYCDTPIMVDFINGQYAQCASSQDAMNHEPRLLTLDTCPTHLTIPVLEAMAQPSLHTTVGFIPEGMTPYLQPVDTHINKPMKSRIMDFLEQRIESGWTSGFPGKKPIAVRERRILMTKVVADAWHDLHQNPNLIQKSFVETGIGLNPLGTEDERLKIRDMDGLMVGDYSQGGLNCNLEPGLEGKKRRTGAGIMAVDNWPALIQLFKDKGIPADQHEVQERADDDELFDLDVVEGG
jgi:hypothetical protein